MSVVSTNSSALARPISCHWNCHQWLKPFDRACRTAESDQKYTYSRVPEARWRLLDSTTVQPPPAIGQPGARGAQKRAAGRKKPWRRTRRYLALIRRWAKFAAPIRRPHFGIGKWQANMKKILFTIAAAVLVLPSFAAAMAV